MHTALSRVGQFSNDGQWWWDGTRWIAVSQVVIPQLPMTDFERAGQLNVARDSRARDRRHFWAWLIPLSYLGLIPGGAQAKTLSQYRTWTLEQLALATSYLFGPDEPMLAGEVSGYELLDSWVRDRGLAVTNAHVIIFRIDSIDGQPRWIELVARLADVRMEQRKGMLGMFAPGLDISAGNRRWVIRGFLGSFKPDAVLEAWRKSTLAAAPSTA